MNGSASNFIDALYKLAANEDSKDYQKPIVCEVCQYEGQPEYDGRCPRCGAVGGITPHDPAQDKPYEGLVDNQLRDLNFDYMARDADVDSLYW